MIIKQQWQVICRGCGAEFTIHEYEGLEGGRYGSHHCDKLMAYMTAHPHWKRTFDYVKEPKRGSNVRPLPTSKT